MSSLNAVISISKYLEDSLDFLNYVSLNRVDMNTLVAVMKILKAYFVV